MIRVFRLSLLQNQASLVALTIVYTGPCQTPNHTSGRVGFSGLLH